MKRLFLRFVVYLITLVIFVGGVGVFQFMSEQKNYWVAQREQPVPAIENVAIPKHNTQKPTVAVVLGSPTTEVFDFMVPYKMFSMTNSYNVYAVAPTKDVTTLSGGLDLVPHYSFSELDELLNEKSPDLIVIPYMPMVDEDKYSPVRTWLQKHSETNLLSICGGSGNLADAGILKGKSATIHWQFFDKTKKYYTETNWIRDLRYVQDGNIVGTAGLTSGIDGVLYVISQQLGEPIAEKIAKEMHYPSYHFVKNPKIDPYYVDLSEGVYFLNQAFQWNEKETGVLLYNGIEDGALASIYDTYAAAGTSNVFSLSNLNQLIITKHQLNIIPRYSLSNEPKKLDRIIVPGEEARSLATEESKMWAEKVPNDLIYMHNDSPERFIFDAPLEDLAKQEDILTAKYGAKRLEYRSTTLDFKGIPFSIEAFGNALITILISLFIAFFIDRRFILKKKFTRRKVA